MEKEEYKGYTIKIQQDELAESPRDWDNLGTMVCWHSRYKLGDKQISREDAYEQWQRFSNGSKYLCLPLYLYDHSGITMSTSPFSCPWDSGQVGFIYISYERIQEEYGRMDTEQINKVREYLINEVKTYDQFLTGDVYYYSIEDDEGEMVDSCGGFFGYDYCLEQAKEYIDSCLPEQLKLDVA